MSKSGTLFVVATPIGNLGDLTPRARETLAGVDLVLAEDTRHTAGLLTACGIERPLASLHDHNEAQQVPGLVERLRRGENLALVSDAGTPLISDPGYRLVCAAAAAQVPIRAVPGACAALAALSVAGLPSDRFAFEGFLPAKSAARRAALESLCEGARTLIFYEAPHRLRETLDDLAAVLGDAREAVIARELTKAYESVYRGTLAQLAARAVDDADMSRGEIVIIVAGAPATEQTAAAAELDRALGVLLTQLPVRQAAELAAQLTGAAPNAAYRRALELSAAAKA